MLSLLVLKYFSSQAYKLLGIKPNCTLQQVKSAYYRQALIYHPDKNPDGCTKQKFNNINEAYNKILTDLQNGSPNHTSEKYQEYPDTSGHRSRATEFKYAKNSYKDSYYDEYYQRSDTASSRWQEFYHDANSFYNEDMEQLMKEYQMWEAQQKKQWKQERQKQAKKRREEKEKEKQGKKQEKVKAKVELNIHATVELTNAEFTNGCVKQVLIQKHIPCDCPQTKSSYCRQCQGTGVKFTVLIQGFAIGNETCDCVRRKRRQKCVICQGKGHRLKPSTELIRIPKNSQPNQILKIPNKGNRSNEHSGDLFVTLVNKLKGERVEGDFHSVETISVAEAVLGTTIEVKTMSGKQSVEIPRGFVSGEVVVLKGQGYLKKGAEDKKGKEREKNVFGDHYVKVNVRIPTEVSELEEYLYKELLSIEKEKRKNCV